MSARQLNVLTILPHDGLVRHFESVFDELCDRGHRVRVLFDTSKGVGSDVLVQQLAERHERLDWGFVPKRGKDARYAAAWQTRVLDDYVHFLGPAYADAHKLRRRAGERLSRPTRRSLEAIASLPGGLDRLARATSWLEAPTETISVLDRQLDFKPDVVLVSPVFLLGSMQVDHLRWAKRHGIPVALPLASWDNLSTKGRLHELPDAMYVWNEQQAEEAERLHGVARDRLTITGAPVFDRWFERRPTTGRREFFDRLRLGDPERPLLMYVGSSLFIAPDESDFIERWIRRLREERGLGLDAAAVLVRPHPLAPFDGSEPAHQRLREMEGVAVWPWWGEIPETDEARADFFDSLHHASAVVGINTSAIIEAAIAGRPTLTLLSPKYRSTQEETLHFAFLRAENGGPLQVAADWREHGEHLAAAIAARGECDPRAEAFVRSFVRPYGLDIPAAGFVADAVEETARRGPSGRETPGRVQKLTTRGLGQLALANARREAAGDDRPHLGRRIVHAALRQPAVASAAEQVIVPVLRGTARRLELAVRNQQGLSVPAATPANPMIELDGALDALVASGRPVIAGPWTSTLNLELLVWRPLLHQWLALHPELQGRLIICSRGAAGVLYQQMGAEYVDLSTLVDVPQSVLAVQVAEDGGQEEALPLAPSGLGETLTRELTPRLREAGMAPPLLLDPVGVMRVFAIARKRRSLQPLEALVTFPAVELPDGTGRPALLFTDHTDGFQPTPANHALLDQLQAHLADQGRVQTVAVARAGRTGVDVEMSGDPGIVARLTELIDGASLVVAAQGGITDLATARGVPVIALVDADAPQSHALTALRDLARTASPSPSVVLTEGDELEHAFSALAALPDPLHRPR